MANKKIKEPETPKNEDVAEEVSTPVALTEVKDEEPIVEEIEKKEEIATVVAEPKLTKQEKTEKKKADKENKRRFGNVMSTSSFIRMFILLLIPGINVILIIFWALGASKNRNKVNLSRGLIVFFLIEVLLALLLFGIGYIYIDRKEATVINYIDKYSNGVLTYLEIDSYEDLYKLNDVSKYLVEKTSSEEETEEVVIPKTCYIYNPVGIGSYDEFMKLYNEQFNLNNDAVDSIVVSETGEEQVVTEDKSSLFDILESNNVDTEKSTLIYIIIDNDNENTAIIFDPTGKFQAYPTVQVNGQYVYVGGVK